MFSMAKSRGQKAEGRRKKGYKTLGNEKKALLAK